MKKNLQVVKDYVRELIKNFPQADYVICSHSQKSKRPESCDTCEMRYLHKRGTYTTCSIYKMSRAEICHNAGTFEKCIICPHGRPHFFEPFDTDYKEEFDMERQRIGCELLHCQPYKCDYYLETSELIDKCFNYPMPNRECNICLYGCQNYKAPSSDWKKNIQCCINHGIGIECESCTMRKPRA